MEVDSGGGNGRCLVCLKSEDGGGVFEQTVIKRERILSEEELTGAVNLLAKNLEGDEEVTSCSFGDLTLEESAFCVECVEALGEVWRLEEVIKQNRLWQLERLGGLKKSLEASLPDVPNEFDGDLSGWWSQARSHLINLLLKPVTVTVPNVSSTSVLKRKRGRPRKNTPAKVDRKDGVKKCSILASSRLLVGSCSVVLERLKEKDIAKMTDAQIYSSDCPMRRRKLNAYDKATISGEPEKDFGHEKAVGGNIEEDIDLKGKAQSDISDGEYLPSPSPAADSYHEDSCDLSESGKGEIPVKLMKRKINKSALTKRNSQRKHEGLQKSKSVASVFYSLPKGNLLLFKYTPIKVNYNQHFICQEENCGVQVEGADFDAFEQLRGHIVNFHIKSKGYGGKTRICPVCNKNCEGGVKLRRHLFKSHPPIPVICEICWKPMKYGWIKAHTWLHKNEEEKATALASENEIEARVSQRYLNYSVKHKKKKQMLDNGDQDDLNFKHKCKICAKLFSSTAYLHKHEETHMHKDFREKFLCSHCGLTLLSKNALRSHIERKHQPELQTRKRVCPICNQEFHFRDGPNFEMHVRSHTGEKPFKCDQCGKGFSSKKYLKTHGSAHTDERPFQCEFCELSYKRQKNFKAHMRSTHPDKLPDVKPRVRKPTSAYPESRPDFIGPRIAYPCSMCDKVFPIKSRLTYHVNRKHSGVGRNKRPEKSEDFIGPRIAYPCPVCEIVYPYKCRMTEHLRKKHPD